METVLKLAHFKPDPIWHSEEREEEWAKEEEARRATWEQEERKLAAERQV